MSDATYRIEIRSEPHFPTWPWAANITRLSDDCLVSIIPCETRELAEQKGREWVAAENTKPGPVALYVGDDGQDAEVPL